MTHPVLSFFGHSDAPPPRAHVVMLGAAGQAVLSDAENAAWTDTLNSLADVIESARQNLVEVMGSLADTQSLAGIAGFDSIWTSDMAQVVADANATAKYAILLLRDAASGARTVMLQPDGSWAIQKLANDVLSIDIDKQTGLPALFTAGVVAHAPPGSLGVVGPVALVAIVAGTVAIWGLVTWTIRVGLEAARSIALQANDAYSKKLLFACLDKPNSADCVPSLKALSNQQQDLLKADAANKATVPGETQGTVDIVKYGVIGAAIVGLTFAAAKIVPPLLEDMKSKRKAAA